MPRYKILISYDGTPFGGWQIQPNTYSIQKCLEEALSLLLKEKIQVIGSGRTDAGVHARGQVAHFSTSKPISDNFLTRFNHLLPAEIAILGFSLVQNDFHARFHALLKTYHYHIDYGTILSPFKRRFYTHLNDSLELDLLKKALSYFVGTHDFSSFANQKKTPCHPIKTIYAIELKKENHQAFCLEFIGNGFLYKMVRNIVGTLIYVAQQKISLREIPMIFNAKNRRYVPPPAPPQGLFLHKVTYPQTGKFSENCKSHKFIYS